MTTTEIGILRGKLLEACIEKQQMLIDDFNNRIKELLDVPGLGNEEAYDNEVIGQQSQRVAEVDTLNQALALATEEMDELQRLMTISSTSHSVVEPGAIVVTDRDTILVSVSVEQFEVDGEPYVGISTRSPRYLAMKDKRSGDKFKCAGVKYEIVEIY
jgi:hypothetical protein